MKNSIFIKDYLSKLDLLLELAINRSFKKNINESPTLSNSFYSSLQQLTLSESYEYNEENENNLIKKIKATNDYFHSKYFRSIDKTNKLPIHVLQSVFSLSTIETDILLLCLAPYIDERYTKIYAYLQGDVNKNYVTLPLIQLLFGKEFSDRLEIANLLASHATFIRWNLITFSDKSHCVLNKPLMLDINIANFLLSEIFFEKDIEQFWSYKNIFHPINKVYITEAFQAKLAKVFKQLNASLNNNQANIIHLYGVDHFSNRKALISLCGELNITYFELDIKKLFSYLENYLHDINFIENFLTKIVRHVLIQQGCFIINNIEFLFNQENKTTIISQMFLNNITNIFRITFFISNHEQEFNQFKYYISSLPVNCFYLELPAPDIKFREAMWQDYLSAFQLKINLPVKDLASMFNFSEKKIYNIVRYVADIKVLENEKKDNEVSLLEACRAQLPFHLSSMTTKKVSHFTLDDIVLSLSTRDQIIEVISQKNLQNQVHLDWGFKHKFGTKLGMNLLFHGSSGTGKTMAASIIANELSLELYVVDISMIVSKYIGETEKNLKQIFDAANALDAVLFFDEADALFGKRTQVKDAHDRYANIEVSYLLQKIEEYQGITILATNLLHNIDEAFTRRFNYIIEFSFPDQVHRKVLWEKAFPEHAPLSHDINFDFLAQKFKLSGGSISNAAIKAAFYAAQEQENIKMAHIIKAVKNEYVKVGKPILASDFSPY